MRHLFLAALLLLKLICAAAAQEAAQSWLGVEVRSVDETLARDRSLVVDFGVYVISLKPESPAKDKLAAGDVITSVNGARVDTKEQFDTAVRAARSGETLQIGRARLGEPAARIFVKLGVAPARDREGMPEGVKLMIDTGGHTTLIRALAFTPAAVGHQLLSAGDDKVIRVWDLATGKIIKTIRGEFGGGDYGKIYAMALSPDGKWLAVGGYFAPSQTGVSEAKGAIRLYDFESGELRALLKGHKGVVYALAFSNDGKQLISGSGVGDQSAIVWDISGKKPTKRLQGHTGDIYSVGFSPDGKVAATGGADRTLRLWRVEDGGLIATLKHKGQVVALAVSSQDPYTIASGDSDGEIRLWDWRGGRALKTLTDQRGAVGALAFSPDGQRLLAACAANACGFTQSVLEVDTGKLLARHGGRVGHDNSVLAAAVSQDGKLAATAGGERHEIHLWSMADGSSDPGLNRAPAVLAGTGRPVWAVGFSSDGRQIGWGGAWRRESPLARGEIEYWLRLPQGDGPLGDPVSVSSAGSQGLSPVRRAFNTYGLYAITHREGGGYEDTTLDIMNDGNTAASITRGPTDGFRHSAYTFAPDGKTIVSGGGGGMLIAYDLSGKELRRFDGHEGDVWGVAVSPDGRYLISGSHDQTVRLWNFKTGELLVTIFRGEDGEWVMWTPQGYYASSPGADKIVGWQINRGPENAAEYVTAEQLRKHLNRPDIVAKAIQLASAGEAVRTSYGTEFKLSDLLARPAPHLRVLSPKAGATVKTSAGVNVKIALDASPDPVTRIRIQVNGRQLDDFLPDDGPSFAPGDHSFPVPLAKGQNTIVVTALNEIGWSKVLDGTLTVTNETAGDLDKRGTLYILAIGVTKYPGVPDMCGPKHTCDLDFTGADASAFADAMEQRLGKLQNVVRRVLVNGGAPEDAPTAANIVDALGVLREAGPADTVAVFLAGHGVNDGPNYRFVSTDAAATATGALKPSSVVPWYAIEEAIDQAKGRRLLFIDTCHSQGAYNGRLGNSAYYANILAYSSARWDQVAFESPEFGHGFFTEAIVEALTGNADAGGAADLTTVQLNAYVQARVRQLARTIGKEQTPQFFKGRDGEDYTLASFK